MKALRQNMEEKKAAEEKGITDQQFADLLIY